MREQGSHRQRGTADLFFQMSIGPFHISNELDRGASERLEGYPWVGSEIRWPTGIHPKNGYYSLFSRR
jgi:hypothetical protein